MHVSEISRHKCLVYEGSASEQLPVVIPLFLENLRERRRCLYLGDDETIRMVRAALAERGAEVDELVASGALVFSSERPHLERGAFDPDEMLDSLRRAVEDALRDGFTGLCASGDMRWELGPDENFQRLREYEAKLERAFRELPLWGVCQYHRDHVPAHAVEDALTTHRALYVGGAFNDDNLFYLPPELHLSDGDGRTKVGEWMWSQLSRVMKAEAERDKTLRALEELNAALEGRVRQRTADLEAFSYSVSHDLRAPLRAIDGFVRIASKKADGMDDEGKRYIGLALSAAERMGRLIDALLRFFTLGHQDLRLEQVDLSRAAQVCVDDLRGAEPGRAVAVKIEEGMSARADPRLMTSVLSNILGNAWKFTSGADAPAIEFASKRDGGRTVYFVRDNGVGFDMAHEDRLFKGFHRLHSAAEFPGCGIGLATARRILEKHGGDIWADSAPGRGATFYFTLPEN